MNEAFYAWKKGNDDKFHNIAPESSPKKFVAEIADHILVEFTGIDLIDHYDIYEALMNYWDETMQDDVYAISYDGYEAARDVNKEFKRRKDGTPTSVMKDFEGRVIPKKLIIEWFFKDEQDAIVRLEVAKDEVVRDYEELREEYGEDGGLLSEVWVKKGKSDTDVITKESLRERIKMIKDSSDDAEELAVLEKYLDLLNKETTFNSAIKSAKAALKQAVLEQYPQLTMEQIKELVIEKKWSYDIFDKIDAIYSAISHHLSARVTELAQRYENTLTRQFIIANYCHILSGQRCPPFPKAHYLKHSYCVHPCPNNAQSPPHSRTRTVILPHLSGSSPRSAI